MWATLAESATAFVMARWYLESPGVGSGTLAGRRERIRGMALLVQLTRFRGWGRLGGGGVWDWDGLGHGE